MYLFFFCFASIFIFFFFFFQAEDGIRDTSATGVQTCALPICGALTIWEPMEKNLGMQGVAAIVNPKSFDKQAEDKQNNLVVLKSGTEAPVSYWAGFAWDRDRKSVE